MSIVLIALVTVMLAAANGANDNIKGAATLNGLLAAFSGKGIVPADLTTSLPFLDAVGLGAAPTVWLATRLGLPISTTHALLGGLLGAGLAADPLHVSYASAFKAMMLPLLISPLVAILLAVAVVPWLRRSRDAAACVCVEPERRSSATSCWPGWSRCPWPASLPSSLIFQSPDSRRT